MKVMSVNDLVTSNHVYKHFRGKWKELGTDNKSLPRIEDTEFNVKDIESKTVLELEEIINRQEKLLQNKLFLSKLKDKGEKIKKKYEDLQKVLKIVKEKNEFKNSRANTLEPHHDIDSIEWNGVNASAVSNENNHSHSKDDSDEEESNPLQLLARHSVDYPCTIRKRLKDEEEDSSKLIEKELAKLNIEDSKTSAENEDELLNDNYFGHKLLNNLNKKEKSNKKRQLFKTNRPKASNKCSSETTVKVIPIEESLKLMSEAGKNEQVKTYADAAEALKSSDRIGMTLPSTNYLNYRDTNNPQHILDDDDDDEIIESIYFGRVSED